MNSDIARPQQNLKSVKASKATLFRDRFGAGPGLVWCRSVLEKISEPQKCDVVHDWLMDPADGDREDVREAKQYANSRVAYRAARRASQGTP